MFSYVDFPYPNCQTCKKFEEIPSDHDDLLSYPSRKLIRGVCVYLVEMEEVTMPTCLDVFDEIDKMNNNNVEFVSRF